MVDTWFLYGVLLFLVVGSGARGGVPERRFADPESTSDNDLASLCGSFHLLPVGSLGRARALDECLSLRHSLPEGANTNGNKPYMHAATTAKANSVKAKGGMRPTPIDKAHLNAAALKQSHTDDVITDVQHATNIRKSETDNADQQLANDAAAREAEWQQQLADQKANTAYTNDMAAIDAAKRQDVLDAQTVDIAKAKWTKLEETIADAKAKAASDPTVIAEQNVKIKDLEAQRRADEAQRLADEIEAMRDAGLADDAGKAARVKTRTERAHNRAVQAANRETALVEASRARRAAIARQQLLEEQDIVRAKVRAEIEGTEAALALRRKNRATAHTAYQKRIEAYNKEKANIKLRREAFETAEEVRAKRLAKIQEGIDARLKAKVADDLRLANAVENSVSPRHRKRQDHEEECTTDEVGCGRGQCLQDKNKPKSKRCRCQDDDDGKNCEHEACAYDLDDGTGKTTKQKGNKVKNECVRWKAEYRCPCDRAWRLDVACVKKVGFKEMEVADVKCKGLTKPENEYGHRVCELCPSCSVKNRGPRGLEATNGTGTMDAKDEMNKVNPPTAVPQEERRLVVTPRPDIPRHTVVVGCSARMVFVMAEAKRPSSIAAGAPGDRYDSKDVSSRDECEEECLKRDGYTKTDTSNARFKLSAKTHCTWVYYEPDATGSKHKCYFFFTGDFPDPMPPPPAAGAKRSIAQANDRSGFIGFVTYPRRWDLHRERNFGVTPEYRRFTTSQGRKQYFVWHGRANAKLEGENTFAVERRLDADTPNCIATADTVLENAEVYVKRLNRNGKGNKTPVDIPAAWTTYGTVTRPRATVVSASSGLPWTYTVDAQFRVTDVSGDSSVLFEGDRGDSHFEKEFNWANNLMYFTGVDALFCAGHLVAYQHKPANFYFNYAMQHSSSNSMGCWHGAEEASTLLVSLGCNLEYKINIDYDQNGIDTPRQMFAKLPVWAQKVSSKVPRGRRLAAGGPYSNNDLTCHYRYRPFIMNLDFKIKNAVTVDGQGNAVQNHCQNLYPAVQKHIPTMFTVEGSRLISSRVFAYLLSKRRIKAPAEVNAPSTSTLKRFLKAATAARKITGTHDPRLSCYAETGAIAKFTEVELQFDFYYAFLGDKEHEVCLRMNPRNAECPKWTMLPDRKEDHFGILTTAADECVTEKAGKAELLKRDGTNDAQCAKFHYNMAALTFELKDLEPLVDVNNRLTNKGKVNRKKIDELVMGTLVYDDGTSRCLGKDGKFTYTPTKCFQLRVSYYNFPAQSTTRLLQETDGSAGANDGDEDDDDEDYVDEDEGQYCKGAGAGTSEDVCEC